MDVIEIKRIIIASIFFVNFNNLLGMKKKDYLCSGYEKCCNKSQYRFRQGRAY